MEFKRKYFLDYLLSLGGLFLLALFTGKFFYLKELALPLSYDESYYWDWSRHLDWGYYSKPPMVAWLIYLSTKAFGISEFSIRLPALLCITGSQLLLFVLTFKHWGKHLAQNHLFTLAFVPIFFVYSFIMTIDSPLIFFWTLTLYFLVEYLKKPSFLFSLLTGLSLGLALLSKQTALTLFFLIFLYFLLFEKPLFRKNSTFLIFFIALLVYTPNLYWNFKHSFLMWEHTKEHFTRTALNLSYYLKFYGGLLGLFGPLFVPFFFYYGLKFFKISQRLYKNSNLGLKERELFQVKLLNLFYFLSFPPLMGLLFLALFKKFNPNWIMPFFISSYLWTLYFLLQKKITKFFYLLNIFITLALVLLILVIPKHPNLFGNTSAFLFYKFYGWKELAEKVEKYYNSTLPLLASHREIASSLAFYLKSQPQVYVINWEKRPQNQYHLWKKDEELIGKEVLYVEKGIFKPPWIKDPLKLEELRFYFYSREKSFSLWRGIYIKGKEK